MINQEAFQKIMIQMISTFGNKEYPEPKVQSIFKICSDLTEQEFQKIVSHFIFSVPVRIPPTPALFLEQAEAVKKLRHGGQDESSYARLFDPSKVTENGLARALKNMGVKSLEEAIFKVKNSPIDKS